MLRAEGLDLLGRRAQGGAMTATEIFFVFVLANVVVVLIWERE
jgi:hypothetical protein